MKYIMTSKAKYKIAAFILCYNEEKILPHIITHYKQFCEDVFIMNNGSTDQSAIISQNMGAIVIDYDSSEIDELQYIQVKENCYKSHRDKYDYIIVCDADEFVYHPEIHRYIDDNRHVDVFKMSGYEMYYENFDFNNDDYKSVRLGAKSPGHNKSSLFKSNVDIKYGIGCHQSKNLSFESEIELRHLKFINIEYVVERYFHLQTRLSNFNKKNNYAYHYKWKRQEILEYENRIKNGLSTLGEWIYE